MTAPATAVQIPNAWVQEVRARQLCDSIELLAGIREDPDLTEKLRHTAQAARLVLEALVEQLVPPAPGDEYARGDTVRMATPVGDWIGRVLSADRNPTSSSLEVWVDFGHSVILIDDDDRLSRLHRVATTVPADQEGPHDA